MCDYGSYPTQLNQPLALHPCVVLALQGAARYAARSCAAADRPGLCARARNAPSLAVKERFRYAFMPSLQIQARAARHNCCSLPLWCVQVRKRRDQSCQPVPSACKTGAQDLSLANTQQQPWNVSPRQLFAATTFFRSLVREAGDMPVRTFHLTTTAAQRRVPNKKTGPRFWLFGLDAMTVTLRGMTVTL